jgi:hypothetical protein
MSHFLIGDIVTSFRSQAWTVLTFGRNRVLLTKVHGSECGGANPTACFVARAVDPRNRFDESAVIPSGDNRVTRRAGQMVFDTIPWVVSRYHGSHLVRAGIDAKHGSDRDMT